VLCLALVLHIVRIFIVGRIFAAAKGGEAGRIYRAALELLSKKGVRRHGAMTPREFSKIAADRYPDIGADIKTLTEIYYRQRFGHETQAEQSVESARLLLGRIKRAL